MFVNYLTDATSGSTADWAKGALQVKYSYTPELRGTGFVVGRNQIQPSFEELFNGFHAMVQQIDIVEGLN